MSLRLFEFHYIFSIYQVDMKNASCLVMAIMEQYTVDGFWGNVMKYLIKCLTLNIYSN